MKKINNKKIIDFYIKILIVILVLLIFLGIIIYMLKPASFYHLFLMICITGSVVTFYTLLKLRFFEYENSQQFISIKQPYFWKLNPTVASLEFPIDILVGFSIRNGLFTTSLVLIIRSKEQKTKKLYCKIIGLNKEQISELKQSLQDAKEYFEN
ncbi:MAG: hypothetical protein E2600_07295 [Chryseobacterium sp.]|nr:hypothetical protein [Chryseobacterium sp.]